MKTKQLFRAALAAFCVLVMTSLMTGCKEKNDPVVEEPQTENRTPVAAFMDYAYSTTDEMIKVFDITVEYYDSEGNVQTETLTTATWAKSAKSASLPAKFGMNVKIAFKENIDVDNLPLMALEYECSYKSSALDAQNVAVGKQVADAFHGKAEFAGKKIAVWVDSYAKHPVQFLHQFDAKGVATSIAWE